MIIRCWRKWNGLDWICRMAWLGQFGMAFQRMDMEGQNIHIGNALEWMGPN